uniref:Uncharacterized protein n=1 Tax=Promethearchaeum syntrophicum TaxID=2594042 RepID=A0A5B9D6H5_9ARCH|nr:hypothetical protein DSAG12_00364 [Candidatus Prometheoarchaeum syntrophicum]
MFLDLKWKIEENSVRSTDINNLENQHKDTPIKLIFLILT